MIGPLLEFVLHSWRRDKRCDNAPVTVMADARAAFEAGDWRRALDLVSGDPAPDAMELRALASYAAGDLEGAIGLWEGLYAERLRAGHHVEAGRAAVMTAMHLLCDTGLMSPVRGWVRRAHHALDRAEAGPAHALLAAVEAYERLFCGDVDAARVNAALAVELGERHHAPEASVMGTCARVRLALLDGAIDEGLALLDEVGARLMAGEVDPLMTGNMYCELVCAAQNLGRHDLAREWTDVMDTWRRGRAFGGVNGRCRVHRAELLRLSGPASAAEDEALAACAELAPWLRREYGWPLVELGTIRLQRGDLDGAEEAFLAAEDLAWSPQPGFALLLLARGDVDGALALIGEAVARPFPLPWKERPPVGDLQLAPLLSAQSQIAFAAATSTTCRVVADRLSDIAARYPGPALSAMASLARARAALLEGDVGEATAAAETSIRGWSEVGAPYEVAEARLVLADAYTAANAAPAAAGERAAARRAFAAFGADGRVAELDRRAAAPPSGPAVFRRDGIHRHVAFAGAEVVVPDLVGLRYIERLLVDRGREVHVLDLVRAERGAAGEQPGLPVLDAQARASYQRRLHEVDQDIEDARAAGDDARVELAERDRDFLLAELRRATGLGGRLRVTGSDVERARTSVTRSIRYALDRLATQHARLGDHLRSAISTGMHCSYVPDPDTPVEWQLRD
jgi:tetratricopeptide (TPR) repeat protein